MMKRGLFYCKIGCKVVLWLVWLTFLLVGCKRGGSTSTVSTGSVTEAISPVVPSATLPLEAATPLSPTATPEPLAAQVNGLKITLAEYQAELALYKAAAGKELAPEDQQRVVNDLVDQALLAQEAAEKGFTVDETLLQERISRLREQMGGEQALNDWIADNGFDQASFRQTLARAVAAAWMRDQIAASVPKVAEQVHARQILLYNAEEANQVLTQLQAGGSFANLAAKYNPVTAGDMGWFPRGYLLDVKLEEAAFSLQPEQFSQVIQTAAGFHILQVIERDPQRPVDLQALQILQRRAVQEWLQLRQSQANIQILLP